MDHNVSRAITHGLRVRGVDVLTAYEDGANELEDPVLLDRASELGRILFTQDDDFLAEANRRQRCGESFSGVIYAHQVRVAVGECVEDLEIIAKIVAQEEVFRQTIFLPL